MSLDQWETFYRGGAIVTGPAGPDGGYDLELRAAWVEFFSTLPASARVLDIGTGSGVLALGAVISVTEFPRLLVILGALLCGSAHMRGQMSEEAACKRL